MVNTDLVQKMRRNEAVHEAALESLGVLLVLYADGDIPASVRPIVRAILIKAGRDPGGVEAK